MFVQVITPSTDITPIVTVDDALQEFREQNPSAEPEAWARRIAAAERAFELETGLRLRPQTIRAEGRSVAARMVWLPVGPIRTVVAFAVEGAAVDVATVRIIGMNTIAFGPSAPRGGISGDLVLEAEVGFLPALIAVEQPEIKQALLSLIGYWAESGREAAQSQTAPLGGPVGETPWTWRASLERWRLTVAA